MLRRELSALLKGGHAHLGFERVTANLAAGLRSRRPPSMQRSVWELVEHLRLCQEDIVRFSLEPTWKSPSWPEGYWPDLPTRVSDADWAESLSKFAHNLSEFTRLVEDEALDLSAEIPFRPGYTYLRQVLLVADHNAYHLGQIVAARRALGDWDG